MSKREGSRATVSRDEDKRICEATGNTMYGSRKKALKALSSFQRSRAKYGNNPIRANKASRPNSVYRCEHCGNWHWTTRA